MEEHNKTEDLDKFDERGQAVVKYATEEEGSFLSTIERLASRPDVDPEKIKQFMDMQERILDRNAKQAFNNSMMEAQKKIELVVAESYSDQTKSKYADLKTILVQIKPVYTAEGFSLMFYEGETEKEGHMRICVDIMHAQGHTEQRYGDFAVQTTGIAGKTMMTEIHGQGSAISYGRRYLTCMVFNVPTGDDNDAQTASGPSINEQQLSTIVDMINHIEQDEEDFCRFMGVESVDKIPADAFNKAMKELNRKKRYKE